MTARAIADRRALAAVRFRDPVTGSFVGDGLRLRGPGRWVQNRSGDFVLTALPALAAHRHAFEAPPPDPPERSVTVSAVVEDSRGRFLPRAFSFGVPRLPGDASDDLFDPLVIDLPPAPAMALRPAWATARFSVRLAGGRPVEGALLRLHRQGHGELCRGLTDARGEGLVISAGLALFAPGEVAVLDPAVHHSVTLVADLGAIDPSTGRRASPADPDDLWARRGALVSLSRSFQLSPGDEVVRVVEIAP